MWRKVGTDILIPGEIRLSFIGEGRRHGRIYTLHNKPATLPLFRTGEAQKHGDFSSDPIGSTFILAMFSLCTHVSTYSKLA